MVAVSIFISACGGGGGKSSEQVVAPDYSKYSEASCAYKYEQGPQALARSSSENIQTTYFNKKMDMNLLNPVLAASGAEVVDFAQRTGVHYYKTDFYLQNTCEFTASLPEPPSDLSEKFKNSNSDHKNSILGLYLPKNSPRLPSTQAEAAILVRRDANKWILVHEYIHHLFHKEVEKGGWSDDTVIATLDSSEKNFKQLMDSVKDLSSSEKKTKLPLIEIQLKLLNDSFGEYLRRYVLEEMTIETLLGEKLESGDLQLVQPEQRVNGAAYILSSGTKAEDYIGQVQKYNDWFRYSFLSDMETSPCSALSQWDANLNNFKTEISLLSTKATTFLKSQGLTYHGLMATGVLGVTGSSSNSAPAFDCAHAEIPKKANEVFERMRRQQRMNPKD